MSETVTAFKQRENSIFQFSGLSVSDKIYMRIFVWVTIWKIVPKKIRDVKGKNN